MNTADEIRDLMDATGQRAPDMTQALKAIGGDMKSGIKRIGEFFHEQGLLEGYDIGKGVGEKNGFMKGSIVTLAGVAIVGGCYYLYDKHKAKKAMKAHEAEGQIILDAMKASVPDEDADEAENCLQKSAEGEPPSENEPPCEVN